MAQDVIYPGEGSMSTWKKGEISSMHESEKWKWSLSVVSDSSWPREGQPTRLLRPWNFPGKSTGVDCHCLLHDTVQYIPNLWNCISTKLQVYLNILLCCNTLQIVSFPGGSTGKESTFNVGDLDFIPGLGRSPGEEKGYPVQYFGLENSMDCIVHGVTVRQDLGGFHFHFTSAWIQMRRVTNKLNIATISCYLRSSL